MLTGMPRTRQPRPSPPRRRARPRRRVAAPHAALLAQAPPAPPARRRRPRAAAGLGRQEQRAGQDLARRAGASCRRRAPGRSGLDGYDESDHRPLAGLPGSRQGRSSRPRSRRCSTKHAAETDPQVKQDLAIMIEDAEDTLDGFARPEEVLRPVLQRRRRRLRRAARAARRSGAAGAAPGGAGAPEEVRRRRLPRPAPTPSSPRPRRGRG